VEEVVVCGRPCCRDGECLDAQQAVRDADSDVDRPVVVDGQAPLAVGQAPRADAAQITVDRFEPDSGTLEVG
jgi:hypothetical protein